MKRRNLLAGIGAVAGAGCLDSGLSGRSGSGVVLNGVVITNYLNEDETVEIVIEAEEETYVDKEVVAEAGEVDRNDNRYYGGVVLKCEWPETPGVYTARVRLEGDSEWVEIETTDEYDDGCEHFEFVIEDHGLDVTARPCRNHEYGCDHDE